MTMYQHDLYELKCNVDKKNTSFTNLLIQLYSIERVTFQMAKTRLGPEEVEKVLVEQAIKHNTETISMSATAVSINFTSHSKYKSY